MTINIFKVQRLLQLLGQDIQADGYWGPISEAALDAEIAKRQSENPADFWPEIRYFKRREFRCSCGKCDGFPVQPKEHMVRVVDEIRHRAGCPIEIVDAGGSGVRCKQHNQDVGGSATSLHLTGEAADLHCLGKTPVQLKSIAEDVLGNTGEIGLYSWGIHVGVRPGFYNRFKV